MIDVFIEELEHDVLKVYFVQLGCIYEVDSANLDILCDNVISLYIDANTLPDGSVDFQYLPVNIYHHFYSNEHELLFIKDINNKFTYCVKKVL